MISIFTPVYNRMKIIGQLYQSLLCQTSYEFEWIIVDDGSTDNVKKDTKIDERESELEKRNALISIIIPVYNVLPYLKKCIESVISQTYRNLEILLIDDGSDDGSEAVCDQFEKQDQRIKVFHKCNGGLSSARNYGLRYATGDYIGFVDSDDYIDRKMYEHLIEAMNEKVDLAACGVREEYVRRYKRKYRASDVTSEYRIMDNQEAMRELLLQRGFGFSVCNKLFKRKLFDHVAFPEGRSSEDIPVIYQIFSMIGYVVNNGYADYYYVHRQGSITAGDFFEGRLDYYYYAKEVLDHVSANYPQYKNEAMAFCVKSAYSIMGQIVSSSNKWKYQETYMMLKGILADNEKIIRESSFIDENTRKDMLLKLENHFEQQFGNIYEEPKNHSDKDKIRKLSEFYNCLVQWISLKEKGITAGNFMRKKGYQTAAIYGMKELGELLYQEMKNSGVCVAYIIDQFPESIFIDVPVLKPEKPLLPVDVIIVTAIHYFEEIKEELKSKTDCEICSLEDVLFFEEESI